MGLSVVLSLGLAFGIWAFLRHKPMSVRLMIVLVPLAMVVVLIGAANIIISIKAGYIGDSFWTLGTGGRVGVILISTFGLTALFLAIGWKSKLFKRLPIWVGLPMDALVGIVTFAVFYSISPQIYYTLYQFIFPYLPNQVVVKQLLDVEKVLQIARLVVGGSLSDHLSGIALWAILPFTLWMHAHRVPDDPS